MRRSWIPVAAVVLMILAAAPAQAGTYEVVSCGAPGAGGVNRAWVGEVVPAGGPFTIANCGSELLGATSSAKQRAGYFEGVNWSFTAPAGTRITRLVTWRQGQAFCCSGWSVAAYADGAGVVGGGFGGETCTPPSGFVPCTFGATGGVSAASRAEYGDLSTGRVFYSAGCGEPNGCDTANDSGQRFAEYHVYGTAVTIRDDVAPGLTVGGPLLAAGWHRPGDSQRLTFSATDATGIRRLDLIGAATAGGGRACDYTRPASIRVPAASSIRASRRSLSGAGRVRFSGRVRSLGQRFPIRGVILALQGYEDGRWNTFFDTRTNRRGRWSVSYGFSGRPGTYPIRVRIRRQALFPFVLGTSPTVRVRVR